MRNMKPTYKNPKKYKCPYCDFKATRSELVEHVSKKHEELIPEGYDAARAVYDFINGKNYGTCMICKSKVYTWNNKINRYNNLCDNPKCKAEVRRIALERHIRVYNKPTLLGDPEQQEKMLANRRISGTYTFTDGGKITYTGTYEKNALEFIDKVLEIPSKDIQAPGPVLEYEYNGEIHKWITDIYYIPANLLIEVKDGGSNPNNRSMPIYREKQIAKEKMITDLGTYNYLRLTNNDFSQLLAILANMKNEALNNENPKAIIDVNESAAIMGALPRTDQAPEAYIVPYMMNNVFAGGPVQSSRQVGIAYGDSTDEDNVYTVDSDDKDGYKVKKIDKSEFEENYNHSYKLYFVSEDKSDMNEKIKAVHEIINNKKPNGIMAFAEALLGRDILSYEEILLSDSFRYYDPKREERICRLIENGIMLESSEDMNNMDIVETIGNVFICRSPTGYYACTNDKFYMASEIFADLETLKMSGVIDLMNNVYEANSYKKEEIENE